MHDLSARIYEAKLRLLRMHYESECGHIGGNLSCLEILMSLFHEVMSDNDRFVLSKGHAAGALYVTLWTKGLLSDEDLKTFHRDDTLLAGHPVPHHMPEIPFATGSLGHGLPLACGMALAKLLDGQQGRIFCLMSDGEWQEGSNWEALIFAAQHKLPLTLIIDKNGLQGLGATLSIAGRGQLAEQLEVFGVPTILIPGHDVSALSAAMNNRSDGPYAVIAETHKGNGVAFMQDKMEWHYLPLSETLYQEATLEVTRL